MELLELWLALNMKKEVMNKEYNFHVKWVVKPNESSLEQSLDTELGLFRKLLLVLVSHMDNTFPELNETKKLSRMLLKLKGVSY
jgi:hypothetical protein